MGSWWMRRRCALVAACAGGAALVGATTAHAAPEGCEPVTAGTLHAEVETAVGAFAQPLDLEAASAALGEIAPLFACLDEPAAASDIALYARLRATLGFFDQDDAELTRWGHLALALEPEGAWPKPLSPAHPSIADLLESPPSIAPAPDPPLDLPKGATLYINGQRVSGAPEVRVEVPALVQLAGRGNQVAYSAWQDGGAWPDAWPDPSKRVKEEVYKPPSRTAWDAFASVGATSLTSRIPDDRLPTGAGLDSDAFAYQLTQRVAYTAPQLTLGGDVGGDRIGAAARLQLDNLPGFVSQNSLFALSATAGPQLRVGERLRFSLGLTYAWMSGRVLVDVDEPIALLHEGSGYFEAQGEPVLFSLQSGSAGATLEAMAKVATLGDRWDAVVRLHGSAQSDGASNIASAGLSVGVMRRVKEPY